VSPAYRLWAEALATFQPGAMDCLPRWQGILLHLFGKCQCCIHLLMLRTLCFNQAGPVEAARPATGMTASISNGTMVIK
jgi:hypothetical protein